MTLTLTRTPCPNSPMATCCGFTSGFHPAPQVLVEGPLGWQDFPSEGDDLAARLGNPWPTQEGVCAWSDEGFLWSWAPTSGWNSLGAIQSEYRPLREVIPCGDGAFLQDENQWIWADSDSKDLQRPVNAAPGSVREGIRHGRDPQGTASAPVQRNQPMESRRSRFGRYRAKAGPQRPQTGPLLHPSSFGGITRTLSSSLNCESQGS